MSISAKRTDLDLDNIIMEPVRANQCSALQTNPLSDSFFLSEGGNNHILVKRSVQANK